MEDASSAAEIIKRVNYYRLSGYGIGLMDKEDPEKYLSGIIIESLYRLYCFGSCFKNMPVHVIEQIEIQLRARISSHPVFLQKKTRDGTKIHTDLTERFRQECRRQKNVPFVKLRQEKYDEHYPVWAAVKLFTSGSFCSLYNIMVREDQKAAAALLNNMPLKQGLTKLFTPILNLLWKHTKMWYVYHLLNFHQTVRLYHQPRPVLCKL